MQQFLYFFEKIHKLKTTILKIAAFNVFKTLIYQILDYFL